MLFSNFRNLLNNNCANLCKKFELFGHVLIQIIIFDIVTLKPKVSCIAEVAACGVWIVYLSRTLHLHAKRSLAIRPRRQGIATWVNSWVEAYTTLYTIQLDLIVLHGEFELLNPPRLEATFNFSFGTKFIKIGDKTFVPTHNAHVMPMQALFTLYLYIDLELGYL